ncbi:MAG: hypothetical protein CH6_0629 [Candidatus Kapaibacterium sp.]|nr:MAG: hypothetical protein CH6_0629 [Candidatus Kapabacteria bacterium]
MLHLILFNIKHCDWDLQSHNYYLKIFFCRHFENIFGVSPCKIFQSLIKKPLNSLQITKS